MIVWHWVSFSLSAFEWLYFFWKMLCLERFEWMNRWHSNHRKNRAEGWFFFIRHFCVHFFSLFCFFRMNDGRTATQLLLSLVLLMLAFRLPQTMRPPLKLLSYSWRRSAVGCSMLYDRGLWWWWWGWNKRTHCMCVVFK